MPDTDPQWLPDWIKQEGARRSELRKTHGELLAAVARILFEEDPMGVNYDTNTDEYEPEAGTVIPRLKECRSATDVARIVHQECARWFAPGGAGPESKYARVGERIWDVWHNHGAK